MVNVGALRTAFGIIGNVISFGLFLSPCPTFFGTIRKAKSVQEFSSIPYIVTLFNCALWVFYGLPIVKKDSILVAIINGIGLVIEAVYVAMYIWYSHGHKKLWTIVAILLEAIVFGILVIVTLTCLHGEEQRSTVVGSICMALNICMYAAPLSIMFKVIKTKSVRYMPFWLSFASFLNGVIWLAYACIKKFDRNVAIPNGVGVVFALLQLALYAWYYGSTNWEDEVDDLKKPAEIQLSDNSARV